MSGKIPSKAHRQAGFTVIEALIALAIVSVVLASIGSLVATNVQSTRHLEQHVALMETARLVASSLPRQGEPLPSNIAGKLAGFAWQMRASPFSGQGPVVSKSAFVPELIELKVRSPSGATVSLQTIRLQSRSGR